MEWQSQQIKKLAKERNIKLEDLAKIIGVSRQTINSWINGKIPKGNHFLLLSRALEIKPAAFFEHKPSDTILVPVHRAKGTAKITPEVQSDSRELAGEYEHFFKSVNTTDLTPVLRSNGVVESALLAQKLRMLIGVQDIFPLNIEQVCKLLDELGIFVIFRSFPEKIKSYAFFTKIYGNRVIFVNTKVHQLDIVFALLHEAVHAVRDEILESVQYDDEEEKLCDEIASYVQFPESYIDNTYEIIKGRNNSEQQKILKEKALHYNHALYGLTLRINAKYDEITFNASIVDAKLRKASPTIENLLFNHSDAQSFIGMLGKYSPRFMHALKSQLDQLTNRRIMELLGLEESVDAPLIRKGIEDMRIAGGKDDHPM